MIIVIILSFFRGDNFILKRRARETEYAEKSFYWQFKQVFSVFLSIKGSFYPGYMFYQFLVTGQPDGCHGLCLSLLFLSAQLQNPRGDIFVVLWHTGKARGKSVIIITRPHPSCLNPLTPPLPLLLPLQLKTPAIRPLFHNA